MTGETTAVGPAGVVERYRKLLDSPYGQELHDFAEIPILAAYLRVLVELAEQAVALTDEFGILDHGGGLRHASTEPHPMLAWNMAVAVEMRPKGAFDPGSRRPATLMRRKATDWAEIPQDVLPAGIFPGYRPIREANA